MSYVKLKTLWAPAFFVLCLLPLLIAAKDPKRNMSCLGPSQEAKMEAALTKLVADIVAGQERDDGQGSRITATVDVVPTSSLVTISMSRSFLPSDFSPALEDQMQQIVTEVTLYIYEQFDVSSVNLLIDGRSPLEYFPEYAPKRKVDAVPNRPKKNGGQQRAAS